LSETLATTVTVDIFSGFKFESLTSLDLMNSNPNEAVPGGWKFAAKNQFLNIYLQQV
jgi:hypothetical protein